MRIHYPTRDHPFIIPKQPITLRVACSAGVNRSAVVREYLSGQLSPGSQVYNHYGAADGDIDAKYIYAYHQSFKDGFYELFGKYKDPNIQTIIFDQLGYDRKNSDCRRSYYDGQKLNDEDREKYSFLLYNNFWNIKPLDHNIFIIINNKNAYIDLVKKRLSEIGKPVDLIVIKLNDNICNPSPGIEPHSYLAYKFFLDDIIPLFKFE